MARPRGSARINTAWQLRVNEALRLLSTIDKAFAEGDDAMQGRRAYLRDAMAELTRLDARSTNKDAYVACQEAMKHVGYALALRTPR